ncbi:N-acetyltransferase family protein [Clostridium fermenticellae]|uniref:N-acetyltransferase family protein n=1 Tax=Clostridium fermenticellae TaxID=2068654 RepID=A0A386H5R6_9CLOT|nr:GNAT family N-acetyltransferase [Clostridium fermenticellae]AYD40908.1 N-acetyltransferase family protein [Clostridium fermenticellae]
MKPQFVYAQIEDLPRIVEIYNQTIPTRIATADLELVSVKSRKPWFETFDPTSRPLWNIKLDGNLVGFIGLEEFYGRPAYKKTSEVCIYIDQNFRGQKLGQAALDFIAGQLKSLDIDTLLAFVFGHNIPSQNLFMKNGFKTWGHLPEVALMDGVRRDLDILGKRYY